MTQTVTSNTVSISITPSSDYTISLSAPSSGKTGEQITMTATVENNGSGVPGIVVTLTDQTTGTTLQSTTGTGGVASFLVEFKESGDYSLYASAVVP